MRDDAAVSFPQIHSPKIRIFASVGRPAWKKKNDSSFSLSDWYSKSQIDERCNWPLALLDRVPSSRQSGANASRQLQRPNIILALTVDQNWPKLAKSQLTRARVPQGADSLPYQKRRVPGSLSDSDLAERAHVMQSVDLLFANSKLS